MSFASPYLLWCLVLVPVLGAGYVLVERRRMRSARAFSSEAMLPNVVPHAPGWRRHVPVALLLAGIAALLLAIARPQAALSVPRERATVVLAIDASKSMESRDIEPTRLVAARRAADGFVDDLPARFQIGVVSFARRTQILSRATRDRVAVRRALRSLETRWGTAIGDGLMESLGLRPRGESVPMVVVLLSDGNNTTGEVTPTEAAAAARRRNVRVHAIALGRRPGEPAVRAGSGRPSNQETLRAVAETSRGRFFSAPSRADLEAIYRELGSSVATVRDEREVTALFVAAALVLLLAGGGLSALWFNRLV